MRCDDVMKRDVLFVSESDNVHTAARIMRDHNVGFLPVCAEERRPVGTLTDRDIALRICAEDHRASNVSVQEVMTPEVISCRPSDDVQRAAELMREHHKSRVMVCTDDGKLMGVISLSDIAEREEPKFAAETLREIASREAHA